ncbi:MAG: HAD hydrolase-like protein [Clostridia bacterium]|nr:HAD hydrolase-like protein [Clostridia bacterium]
MPITTVLFDLDGTLLPMDQETFTRAYFTELGKKLAPHGYDPKELVSALWAGVAAMVKNDGSRTNEQAFWKVFASIYGEKAYADTKYFDEFYRNDFNKVQPSCGFNPEAKKIVDKIKAKGYRVALPTNPLFPDTATMWRIRWAGFEPDEFEYFTTYDNSSFCKPNPKYYQEFLDKIGARPEECLMVGNDVDEDMIAEALGMKVFLLTDCMINRHKKDISQWPHGGYPELNEFIDNL